MSSSINREDAIDAVANALWHYPNEQYKNFNDYEFAEALAKDALLILPSAEAEWIPCSERLPEENETVLISAKYIGHLSKNDPYVEEGFLTHDGWYSVYGDNYSELLAEVVAWMPLPKPYKGGDDE